MEKSEYRALDFFRIICAALVVCIHIQFFSDVNARLSFLFNYTVCRIGVPFFFLVSGFFVDKKIGGGQDFWKYTRRLIGIYGVYSLIYIPVVVRTYLVHHFTVQQVFIDFLIRLFIKGIYPVLWFFPSLITSLVLLRLMLRRMSIQKVILWSGVLYTLETLMNNFKSVFQAYEVFKWYYTLPVMPNGFFFGLFLISIGYFIKTQRCHYTKRALRLVILLLFILLYIEVITVWKLCDVFNASIAVVPLTTAIFLLLKDIPISKMYEGCAKYCRKLSVCIYGLHMFFAVLVEIFESMSAIHLHSVARYVVVLGITILASSVIIYFSKKYKAFRWLQFFY